MKLLGEITKKLLAILLVLLCIITSYLWVVGTIQFIFTDSKADKIMLSWAMIVTTLFLVTTTVKVVVTYIKLVKSAWKKSRN
jgi:uncharacterized membrane protein